MTRSARSAVELGEHRVARAADALQEGQPVGELVGGGRRQHQRPLAHGAVGLVGRPGQPAQVVLARGDARLDDLELADGPLLGEHRGVEVGLGRASISRAACSCVARVVEGLLGDDQVGLGLRQVLGGRDQRGGVVRLLGGPPGLLLGLLARLLGGRLALRRGPLSALASARSWRRCSALASRVARARAGGRRRVGGRGGQPGADERESDGGEQAAVSDVRRRTVARIPRTALAHSPPGSSPTVPVYSPVSPHVVPPGPEAHGDRLTVLLCSRCLIDRGKPGRSRPERRQARRRDLVTASRCA